MAAKKKEKVEMNETKYTYHNKPYTYTYNITVKTNLEIN